MNNSIQNVFLVDVVIVDLNALNRMIRIHQLLSYRYYENDHQYIDVFTTCGLLLIHLIHRNLINKQTIVYYHDSSWKQAYRRNTHHIVKHTSTPITTAMMICSVLFLRWMPSISRPNPGTLATNIITYTIKYTLSMKYYKIHTQAESEHPSHMVSVIWSMNDEEYNTTVVERGYDCNHWRCHTISITDLSDSISHRMIPAVSYVDWPEHS